MSVITVEVTKKDIEQGTHTARCCPVALAIGRCLKPGVFVSVHKDYIHVIRDLKTKTIFTPKKARFLYRPLTLI